MADMPDLTAVVIAGSIAGAVFSIWRLFDKIKNQGAEQQKIQDKIRHLEDQMQERRETTNKIYIKLEEMSKDMNAMKLKSAEDHAEILQRIAVVEQKMEQAL